MYISDRYRVNIEGLVVAYRNHLVALLVVLHAPNLVEEEVSLMKKGKIYEERKPLATFANFVKTQWLSRWCNQVLIEWPTYRPYNTWSEWSVKVWRHCLVATSQTLKKLFFQREWKLVKIWFAHLDTAVTAARHKMVIVRTESNTENLIHCKQWSQFSYKIIDNRLPTQLVWPDMVAIRAAWTTSYLLSTYSNKYSYVTNNGSCLTSLLIRHRSPWAVFGYLDWRPRIW